MKLKAPLTALFGLACLGAPVAHAAPGAHPVRILGPGTYYRMDVPKDLKGAWWVLYKEKESGSWMLKLAMTEIRPSAMKADSKGRQSGVEIGVSGLEDAMLLIRNLPANAGGTLVVAESVATTGKEGAEQRATGAFRGEPFAIWSEAMGSLFALRLESGGVNQVLCLLPDCEDCTWDLLWAGDLDGDGKLDLLVASTGEKSRGTLRLFLSSAALPHQRMGLAASHGWTFGD